MSWARLIHLSGTIWYHLVPKCISTTTDATEPDKKSQIPKDHFGAMQMQQNRRSMSIPGVSPEIGYY
jgi:hypothetical protein